jgi:hypothetical protein
MQALLSSNGSSPSFFWRDGGGGGGEGKGGEQDEIHTENWIVFMRTARTSDPISFPYALVPHMCEYKLCTH